MSRRILLVSAVAGIAVAASAPTQAWTLGVEAGRAEFKTETFRTHYTFDEDFFVDVPAFRRDAATLAMSVRTDGRLPVHAGVFMSNRSEFWRGYPTSAPPPTVGPTVRHRISASGVRLSLNPSMTVGAAWVLDGHLGVQHTRVRDASGGVLAGAPHRHTNTGPYAGAGVSYAFSPRIGVRIGVDVAEAYRSASLGLRYRFD